MRSAILWFPAKQANRAMLTSTIRLTFETTIERRRNCASQCRCRALSRLFTFVATNVVVAVGTTRGQLVFNNEASRMTAAVDLARKHPEARLVFSGGTGSLLGREVVPEANAAGM